MWSGVAWHAVAWHVTAPLGHGTDRPHAGRHEMEMARRGIACVEGPGRDKIDRSLHGLGQSGDNFRSNGDRMWQLWVPKGGGGRVGVGVGVGVGVLCA